MVPQRPPITPTELLLDLLKFFRHNSPHELQILRSARGELMPAESQNGTKGLTSWNLRLVVPQDVFTSNEQRVKAVQTNVHLKCDLIMEHFAGHKIVDVRVLPASEALFKPSSAQKVALDRLWDAGLFRLFLSHVSTHREAVSSLKTELRHLGVSAFVAHDDIEPTMEWQAEIEEALRTMQSLSALITSDFHGSYWTDQEVGWALASDVLVIPIRLAGNPYGFMGRIQGLNGRLEDPLELAHRICVRLIKDVRTGTHYRASVLRAVELASTDHVIEQLSRVIGRIDDFTPHEVEALRETFFSRAELYKSPSLRKVVYQILETNRVKFDDGSEEKEHGMTWD